jgi:hypothetical protein
MKFANATKFPRKSGKGWEINLHDDPSAVGAVPNLNQLFRQNIT